MDETREARQRRGQSLIDFAKRDIERLRARLGNADVQRLDGHLTALREIERRVSAAPVSCSDASALATQSKERYNYSEGVEYGKLMLDMHVLALRCDLTHVSFASMGTTGSTAVYPSEGVDVNHHCISHSGDGCDISNQPERRARLYTSAVIFYMKLLAYYLDRLSAPDATGRSLLDDAAFIAFSEFSDGGDHYENYVPFLVGGKAGRTGAAAMQTGQHLLFPFYDPIDWKNTEWLPSW